MFIPAHYLAVLVLTLLGQFGIIFVYTLIGLLKSNPVPWLTPPGQLGIQSCQGDPRDQSTVRGGAQLPDNQASSLLYSTSIVTSTSLVYQTYSPAGAALVQPAQPMQTVGSQTMVQSSLSSSITTVTSLAAPSTIEVAPNSPGSSASSVYTGTSNGASSVRTITGSEPSNSQGDAQSEGSTQATGTNVGSAKGGPSSTVATDMSNTKPPVTSLVLLTSTLPPSSESEKTRPTSTTVVVVPGPPPASSGK